MVNARAQGAQTQSWVMLGDASDDEEDDEYSSHVFVDGETKSKLILIK